MHTLEDIEKAFGKEVYETIYFDLKTLAINYDFLGFKSHKWVSLACKNANKAKEENVNLNYASSVIINNLEKELLEYIKNEYRKRNIRIFNNLFIKLLKEKLSFKQLIDRYITLLEDKYGLKFDFSFYNFLKQESREFRKILTRMEMLDFYFDMFKMFFLDNYELYYKFMGNRHSFGWTVSKVNELSRLGIISLSGKYFEASCLVIINYEIIVRMHEQFSKSIEAMPLDDFISLIIKIRDAEKIKETINEYKKSFIYKESYDIAVLTRLNNLFKKISDVEINREKIIATNTKVIISDAQKPETKKRKKITSIYDLFPDIEGISEEEKRKKVDKILERLTKEELDEINLYINGDDKCNRTKIRNKIQTLKILYNQYIKTGILPKVRKSKLSLEDYFPDIEEITIEEKKKMIKEVLEPLPEERRLNVIAYANSDKDNITDIFQAKTDLSMLRRKYVKYAQSGKLSDFKALPKSICIYDLFPDIEGITPEKKKEMIKEVLELLPEERRLNVMAYVNRDKDNVTDRARAKTDLSILQRKYVKYAQSGKLSDIRTLPKRNIDILDYIQVGTSICTKKIRQQIINAFISTLDSDEREKLKLFINSALSIKEVGSILLKITNKVNTYLNDRIVNLNLTNNNYQIFYSLILFLDIDYETKFNYKLDLFILELKKLVYKCRKMGFSKEEYQNWILGVSIKIDPNLKLDAFLEAVIDLAYYEITYYQENDKRGR